jgi:hypothetical protein
MNVFRVQIEAFCIASQQSAALARANGLQSLVRLHGFEPNGAKASAVADGDVKHLPKRARELLERETRAEYGPGASMPELAELRTAVLAANGGQITEFEDELRAISRSFGYPPRRWVQERLTRALERATSPEVATA